MPAMKVTKRRSLNTLDAFLLPSPSSSSFSSSASASTASTSSIKTSSPVIVRPSTTKRSIFFKWDRPARRRNNDTDEGFSDETDLVNGTNGYFSDTNSTTSKADSDDDENRDEDEDKHEDDHEHEDDSEPEDHDDEFKVSCLDFWEKGYRDPCSSPAAEPTDEEQQYEGKLSTKLTEYDAFFKVWHELHEMAAFEKDLEYIDQDETIWQFLERMREDNEGEADYAVARWEVYPEPEEELYADKNSDSIFTSRDDTDCQKKHADGEVAPTTRDMMTMQHQDKSEEVEYTTLTDQDVGGFANTDANINNKAQCGQHRSDGEVTNCGDASDSDEETVHGSGSDDDSGKNKDVDRENASGHDAKQFLGANSVEANKMIQV